MGTNIEAHVRSSLQRSARAVTVADDLPARVERRIRLRRRQARGVRLAVAAFVVAAVGAASVTIVDGRGDGISEVMAPAVGSPAEGMWEPLPEAPISARFQHAAVWTGDEMIVVGGYDGGEDGEGSAAAYSPATGTWRRLADPPDEVRGAPIAVWTGSEVVAFGGDVDSSTHGAAYDPEADDWRTVAEAPLGALISTFSHAVWTGDQVLVAGFLRTGDDDEGTVGRGAALFDPATDEWIELPEAPDTRPFGDAVWTGDELVFIAHDDGSGSRAPQRMVASALDPEARTWRELPAPPLDVRSQPLVAWSGSEVIVGGGHAFSDTGMQGTYVDAAAFDPVTDTWRALPDAPAPFQGSDRYVDVAVDGRVIAFDTANQGGRVLVLDPATGRWDRAPAPNRPDLTDDGELPGRREAPVVSTGRQALAWGGGVARIESDGNAWGCCRPVGEGAAFTPPVVAPAG